MRHHGSPAGGGAGHSEHVEPTGTPWPTMNALPPLHVQVEARYDHTLNDGTVVRLQPVSSRPPLAEYLRRIASRRHFIRMQAWLQAQSTNSGFVLGNLWLIMAPLLDAAVYFIIFALLFHAGDEYFVLNLIVGILLFTITTRMLTSAASSVSSNGALMRAFAFPRAVLPIATILREVFSSAPVFLAVLVLIWAIPPHAPPALSWLLVPVLFALQVGLGLGLGLIAARLGHDLPDARKLIPYLVRALMYGSAVVFTIDRFASIPWLYAVVQHNPIYLMVDMYRTVLIRGEAPAALAFIEFTGWVAALVVLGFVYFWRGELRYGRQFR